MSEAQGPERTTQSGSVTPERFARVRAIFEAALSRPAPERRAYVDGACGDDREMQREVQAMVLAEGRDEALMEPGPAPPPSSAPEEGRFPAGTVLAGRYRVLGLLGRGGMGEVYRAHDQILNQAVALKFLSPTHFGEAALIRFRNEVRIARQVSHPNVCRVYDLGMVEGLHFLSMEYIDGEDLAGLLRRIGRLPQDKAIEFTRKICAGLGAAHDRGVLHRDLKPANIMIDGRGQVRITDFGLAGLAAEIPLSDLRSGTPAYMSPEQKAGKEVSTRSDIYALGLVLHEMFTGKQRTATQSNPSDLVKELDPAIDRLILRCLEEEPKRRPNSAFSVALALPGADPVAAALAAGETPSPEMVAASQEKEGFLPRTAVLCFAGVVLCLVAGLWLSNRVGLLAQTPMPLPPEALADRAQQLVRSLGYAEDPVDQAYGFDCCNPQVVDLLVRSDATRRAEIFSSHRPPLMRFWYRQHRRKFDAPSALPGGIGPDSPPVSEDGMIRVEMDGTGKLVRLDVRPWTTSEQTTAVDWKHLFSAAGLDLANFSQASPAVVPRMSMDERMAWTGRAEKIDSEPIRIEAASWQGRPVFFALGAQKSVPPESRQPQANALNYLLTAALVAAAWVAWNNRKLGRGDRRGAAVLATTMFLAMMGSATFGTSNSSLIVTQVLPFSCFAGALTWIFYTAAEPYVRRHWPDGLTSWARLASGRFRDPLIASHILAGILAAEAFSLVGFPVIQSVTSLTPFGWWQVTGRALTSLPTGFSVLLGLGGTGVGDGLLLLVLVVILRRTIGRLFIADVLASVLLALATSASFAGQGWSLALAVTFLTITSMIWIWLLRRFGFLAMLSLWVVSLPAVMLPLRATGWAAGRSIPFHLIPIALAAWALWVILSAQRQPSADLQA